MVTNALNTAAAAIGKTGIVGRMAVLHSSQLSRQNQAKPPFQPPETPTRNLRPRRNNAPIVLISETNVFNMIDQYG
jgi:hypothetical protein